MRQSNLPPLWLLNISLGFSLEFRPKDWSESWGVCLSLSGSSVSWTLIESLKHSFCVFMEQMKKVWKEALNRWPWQALESPLLQLHGRIKWSCWGAAGPPSTALSMKNGKESKVCSVIHSDVSSPAQLRSRLLPQSVQKKSCSGGDQQPTVSHLAWWWEVGAGFTAPHSLADTSRKGNSGESRESGRAFPRHSTNIHKLQAQYPNDC